jgi:hypothetical protein
VFRIWSTSTSPVRSCLSWPSRSRTLVGLVLVSWCIYKHQGCVCFDRSWVGKIRNKRKKFRACVLSDKSSLRVCSFSFMWLIRGRFPTIGIRARSRIWSCACPEEATASASGRAIVGRRATGWRRWTCRRRRGGGRLPFVKATRRGDRALSSWRRWTRMIVDGRGGAEVRCRESRQDHRPGELEESKSQVRASWHVESGSSLWVVVVSRCLFLWGSVVVEACHVRGVAREQGSTCAKTRWRRGHLRVIRLKRIYNFRCSMLVFTPFALCFVTLCGTFMRFSELTYWQDATVSVSCFLLFLCFRNATQEIFSELDETSSRTPIFSGRRTRTEREPEGGPGASLTPGRRGPAPGRTPYVWGAPGSPLTTPLRLYKASGRKTLRESAKFPEQFCSVTTSNLITNSKCPLCNPSQSQNHCCDLHNVVDITVTTINSK